MRYITKQIDLLLYVFWKLHSQAAQAYSLWTGRMAEAHFASAKTGKRFTLRRLEDCLYIVVSLGSNGVPACNPVFSLKTVESAKADFESARAAEVIFIEDVETFRKMAIATLAEGTVEHV